MPTHVQQVDNTGVGVALEAQISLPIETVTASSDTLDGTNHTVLCDCTSNAITINLPAISGITGRIYNIKKTDSTINAVTVDGSGSETIDGGLTAIINNQYESIQLQVSASEWSII